MIFVSIAFVEISVFSILFANRLKDVQKRSEKVNINEDPSGWRPYSVFVEYLQEKCTKNDLQGAGFSFNFI